MMKNAFYFILESLFVLKIFKFSSWLFSHSEKRLDSNDKVHFKIHDVATCLKATAMEFGQFIEYSNGTFFIKELYTKCGG